MRAFADSDDTPRVTPNADEALDLRDVVATIFKHQRAILTIVLAAFVAALLYASFTSDPYTATTKLLVRIGREKFAALDAGKDASQNVLFQERVQNVNNEIEILRDPSVIRAAFADLKAALPPTDGGPAPAGLLPWLRYQAKAGVRWLRDGLTSVQETLKTPLYQLGLLRKLGTDELLAERFRAAFQIGFVKETDVITANFTWPDPAFAATAVDIVVAAYRGLHIRVHNPDSPLDFYESKLAATQADLDRLDKAQAKALQDNNTASFPLEQQLDLSTLADLDRQRAAGDVERRDIKSRLEALRTAGATEWPLTSAENSGLSALDRRYIDLVAKRNELATRYRPGAPELALVERDVKRLSQQKYGVLVTEYGARLKLLDERIASIDRDSRVKRKARLAMADPSLRFDRLLERRKILADQAADFQRKIEQLRVNSGLDDQSLTSFSVVAPAPVPLEPSGPRKDVLVALAAFLGLVVAACYVALAEALTQTMESPRDVRRHLALPVIATLPDLDLPRARA